MERRSPEQPDRETKNFIARATRAFRDNVVQSAPLAAASYSLIGAIILLGGIGYALDSWRGTSPWFLLGGLLVGIVVGFYELAKAVWRQ